MVYNFSDTPSVVGQIIYEMRSVEVQKDRMRFRRNLVRLGEITAYEISKHLNFVSTEVETPFGIAEVRVPEQNIVLAGILRAGLPLHEGLMNVLDYASSAFVSTYRKHHSDGSFDVKLEYVTSPQLEGQVLILADPMLATGSTAEETIQALLEYGRPSQIHFVTAIASTEGIDTLRRLYPEVRIWTGAIDEELTAKSYIVPGLGDAGDLCFGEKQIDG